MTKQAAFHADILTIRLSTGELTYVRRDVHEGITATEGQTIRRCQAFTAVKYAKKVAAGYKRKDDGKWVLNRDAVLNDYLINKLLDAEDALTDPYSAH